MFEDEDELGAENIYDDLDDFQQHEEKKSKELQAWEQKFNTAQTEIESLKSQNKEFKKKIKTMEVNLQNLLDTAKAEINRKEALITQLRKEKDDICFRRKRAKCDQQPPVPQPVAVEYNNNKPAAVKAFEPKEQRTMESLRRERRRSRSPKSQPSSQPSIQPSSRRRSRSPKSQSSSQPSGRHRRSRSPKGQTSSSRRDRHRRSRERSSNSSSRHSHSRRSRSRSRASATAKSSARNKQEPAKRRRSKSPDKSKPTLTQTLEALLGQTPTQSPSATASGNNCDSGSSLYAAVLHKLQNDTEPMTPAQLYTPQNLDKPTKSEAEAVKNREDVDSYFAINSLPTAESIVEQIIQSVDKPAKIETEAVKTLENVDSYFAINNIVEQIIQNVDKPAKSKAKALKNRDDVDSYFAINTLPTAAEPNVDKLAKSKPESVETREDVDSYLAINALPTAESIVEQIIQSVDKPAKSKRKAVKNRKDAVKTREDVDSYLAINTLPTAESIVEQIIQSVDKPAKLETEAVKTCEDVVSYFDINVLPAAAAESIEEQSFQNVAVEIEVEHSSLRNAALCLWNNDMTNEQIPGLDLIGEVEVETQPTAGNERIEAAEPILTEIDAYDAAKLELTKEEADKETQTSDETNDETVEMDAKLAELTPETNVEAEAETVEIMNEPIAITQPEEEQKLETVEIESAEIKDKVEAVKELKSKPDPSALATEPSIEKSQQDEQVANSIIMEEQSEEINETPTPPRSVTPQNVSTVCDEDEVATPKRAVCPVKAIQIIEDIRLPIMIDIEHIAVQVDKLEEEKIVELAEALDENAEESKPNATVVEEQVDMATAAELVYENVMGEEVFKGFEDEATVAEKTADLLPESAIPPTKAEEQPSKAIKAIVEVSKKETTIEAKQPDSTETDPIDAECNDVLEAAMNALTNESPLKPPVPSYPNLSLGTDTIELALEQLHHQSNIEAQLDESTATSTPSSALQTPKQLDLIQILSESPAETPSPVKRGKKERSAEISAEIERHTPLRMTIKIKKICARTVSERDATTEAQELRTTPEKGETTPLKKRKVNMTEVQADNKDKDKIEEEFVPQTPIGPPAKSIGDDLPADVTIEETLNGSSLAEAEHNITTDLDSSQATTVTKRCSMGNSDYQFERVNDEVILRVKRRGRRRRIDPPSSNSIDIDI